MQLRSWGSLSSPLPTAHLAQVQGVGHRAQGAGIGCRAQGAGRRAQGAGAGRRHRAQVQGAGTGRRVQATGCRPQGAGPPPWPGITGHLPQCLCIRGQQPAVAIATSVQEVAPQEGTLSAPAVSQFLISKIGTFSMGFC